MDIAEIPWGASSSSHWGGTWRKACAIKNTLTNPRYLTLTRLRPELPVLLRRWIATFWCFPYCLLSSCELMSLPAVTASRFLLIVLSFCPFNRLWVSSCLLGGFLARHYWCHRGFRQDGLNAHWSPCLGSLSPGLSTYLLLLLSGGLLVGVLKDPMGNLD